MGNQKAGKYSYEGKRIFVDENAYEILKACRNSLKVSDNRGAGFSDAIRDLQNIIPEEEWKRISKNNEKFMRQKKV